MTVIISKENGLKHFWAVFFSGMVLTSVFGGVIAREIFNNSGLGYYINYILWISLGIVYIVKERKNPISKEYVIIFCVILLNTIVGAAFGKFILNLKADNFHQGVITGVAILMVTGVNWNDYLDKEDLYFLLKVIYGIGIFASLYAIVIQNQKWIGVLSGRARKYNAWDYRSFFGQRNVYAYFCFLSIVAAMYLLNLTKKKRYLFGMLLLALQIYITDSRTAILLTLLFFAIYLYLNLGKKGKFVLSAISVCLILFIVTFADLSLLIGRFYHATDTSFGDSGSLRLNMWYSGIRYLFSKKAFFCGFGFDSQGPYLEPVFGLRSFHNAYMDILFQGGIIFLGLHLYLIAQVTKTVLKMGNEKYRYISLSFIIVFLFGCLFDSSAMLYSSNYEAVLSTLMVCVLIKVRIENKELFCMERIKNASDGNVIQKTGDQDKTKKLGVQR